jgi:urea carboxylase-associated protein 1
MRSIVSDTVVAPRSPWSSVVDTGDTLRIVDLEGNQAVDCLLYNAHDVGERYSSSETIVAQRNIFLTTGTRLISNEGNAMMTITDDTCGRHDTSGGACSQESNALRYGFHTKQQHACMENFLLDHASGARGKRDMLTNCNWYMNVPDDEDGSLGIVDGLTAPAKYDDLAPEMDISDDDSN